MATIKAPSTEQEFRDYFEREWRVSPRKARFYAAIAVGKSQGDIVPGNSPLGRARAEEWAEQKRRLEQDQSNGEPRTSF